MKDLFEIRIHGRGGQGAKTAAQFIAEAALDQGKNIQSFPEYGPERAGAPMKAFTRISDKQIKTYAPVVNPDVVLVIDPALVNPSITDGLTEKNILIVNTNETKDSIKKKTKFNGAIYCVDATKISIETVGKNLPNTPMLGALIKATNIIHINSINNKIKEKFLGKLGEDKVNKTIEGVKRAFDEVK